MTAGEPEESARPLSGVRVVDLSIAGSAAICAQVLAGFGAEVLHVVRRGSRAAILDAMSEITGADFADGVIELGLDLKTERDRDYLLDVIAQADVVIDGFRPGVAERLGIGPADCVARNPRIVFCRATGWGQQGPLAVAAGHDANFVSITGALRSLVDGAGTPVVPLNLLGEMAGGYHAALAVASGVLGARASGHGFVIDAAQIDSVAALMEPIYRMHSSSGWRAPGQNHLDGAAPFWNVYETADGEYVAATPLEPDRYELFLRILGLDDGSMPDQMDRNRWPEAKQRIADRMATRTRDGWEELLASPEACVTPVLSLEEAPLHPQMSGRGIFRPFAGGHLPRVYLPMTRTGPVDDAVKPRIFAGTDELLTAWGCPVAP